MTDVLIYADTFRSPELRHEVPLGVPDPFLYAEKDGTKHIVIGSMEIPRLAEVGGFELHPTEEFGSDELVAPRASRTRRSASRSSSAASWRSASRPPSFRSRFRCAWPICCGEPASN